VSDHQEVGDSQLKGTTLRVYRYLYRNGKPLGVRDVQRGLSLSSPSVAEYHLKKLLAMGLVKQEEEGNEYSRFIVDRLMFENMIRVKRVLIPMQMGYVVFFGLALVLLVFLFRPLVLNSQYLFSVIIVAAACAIFIYETINSLRGSAV
jgi:DNA-binding transcriptional ArsR family regulator